jgi:class 3 adenylate cyclase/predicted ATPase
MRGLRERERRIVTVVFCDLVGFTSLSEQLDPEDVATLQDAYFAIVEEVMHRYGGRLEKFIGDAAVAVFGIPKSRDDDAERAVRAALVLRRSIPELGADIGLEEGVLQIRVGVNTGEVAYGEAGTTRGAVTGDTVNVAARLQAAAAPGTVLLGQTTALSTAAAIELEPIEPTLLKGKARPVRSWVAVRPRPEPSRDHAVGLLRTKAVGRDRELAILAGALETVTDGRAARFVIVAPPGVGKSRLVREFADAALAEHRAAVWRALLRSDILAPFEPIRQLVVAGIAHAGIALGDPAALGEPLDTGAIGLALLNRIEQAGVSTIRADVVAAEILALLRSEAVEERAAGARWAAAEREMHFSAWLEGLDALAGAETVAWVVEDLHLASPDFLAFLRRAGTSQSQGGRLVLATTRPDLVEADPVWFEVDAGASLTVLHLDPLSRDDTAHLVHGLVGDALPDDLVFRITSRSDGNPLFVEELLRSWVTLGVLQYGFDARWYVHEIPPDVALPQTVQAIYAAQIDDLPSTARDIVRRGAVAGRRLPQDALPALGVSAPEVGLSILERRGLLGASQPDPLVGATRLYRHALLRDAGYASLARAQRARLHMRFAEWLETTVGASVKGVAAAIGRQYEAALAALPSLSRVVANGRDREVAAEAAANWFELAAGFAVEDAAPELARTLLQAALQHTREAEFLRRARLLQFLGEVTAFSADMDEGAQAVQQALDLSRTAFHSTDIDRAAEVRLRYGEAASALASIWIEQLRFDDAARLVSGVLAEIGQQRDETTARLLSVRGLARLALTNRFTHTGTEDLARASQIARTTGNRGLELDVVESVFLFRIHDRRFSARVDWDEALAIAQSGRRWASLVAILQTRAIGLVGTRDEEARGMLQFAAETAKARGLNEGLAWGDCVLSEVGMASGTWADAIAAALRAARLGDQNGYHRVVVRSWFVAVPMAAERKDRPVLQEAAAWWEPRRGRIPDTPYGRLMQHAVEMDLARAGLSSPPDRAPEQLLPSFGLTVQIPSWCLAVERVARQWVVTGQLEPAQEAVERLARTRRDVGAGALMESSEALVLAALLQTTGDEVHASEEARRALAAARLGHASRWIARAIRALEELGQGTSELGDEAAALEAKLGIVNQIP